MAEYTLYTTSICKYCNKAKALLKKHGLAYREVDIDAFPGLRGIVKSAGYTTVPIIFVNGLYTGGYEDLLDRLEPDTDNPSD